MKNNREDRDRAEFIRLRKALGLTQTELGKKMGLTQPQISRIERDKNYPKKIHMQFIRSLVDLNDC